MASAGGGRVRIVTGENVLLCAAVMVTSAAMGLTPKDKSMTQKTVVKEKPAKPAAPTAEAVDKKIAKLLEETEKIQGKIAALRKARPREVVKDYTFTASDGKPVKLSALFGDKDDLIVIHNMGTGCSYCTLWADGFNGFTAHLEDRAAFVVASSDDYKIQKAFAEERGWKFRMCSAMGTTFWKDMGFLINGKEIWPGVSAFHRDRDGSIYRVSRDFLGPGDAYCSVWHLFGLLQGGVQGWEPKLKY
jgi:predicted dithiol-disulfide oxidoreductase (DUF899 family)